MFTKSDVEAYFKLLKKGRPIPIHQGPLFGGLFHDGKRWRALPIGGVHVNPEKEHRDGTAGV